MESKLQALKVVDLKKLLQDANLPVSGAKADLVKRLLENPEATSSLGGEEEEEDLLAEASEPAPVSTVKETSTPSATAPISETQAPPNEQTSTTTTTTTTAQATQKDALLAETLAELEKRKIRAQRWGKPTDEIEAKINSVKQNGITADATVASVNALDGELKTKGRKEVREEKRAHQKAEKGEKKNGQAGPLTEEQRAAKLAKQEAEAEAKKQRAERFGQAQSKAAEPVVLDPVEEEKKRKRMERFGSSAAVSAEPTEKKVKM